MKHWNAEGDQWQMRPHLRAATSGCTPESEGSSQSQLLWQIMTNQVIENGIKYSSNLLESPVLYSFRSKHMAYKGGSPLTKVGILRLSARLHPYHGRLPTSSVAWKRQHRWTCCPQAPRALKTLNAAQDVDVGLQIWPTYWLDSLDYSDLLIILSQNQFKKPHFICTDIYVSEENQIVLSTLLLNFETIFLAFTVLLGSFEQQKKRYTWAIDGALHRDACQTTRGWPHRW